MSPSARRRCNVPGIRGPGLTSALLRFRGTTTYAGYEPSAAEMAAFLPTVGDVGYFKRGALDSVFHVHRRSSDAHGGSDDFSWIEMAPTPQSSVVAIIKRIKFNDASPIVLPIKLKARDLLTGAKVHVTTAFSDASATIAIGTTLLGSTALHSTIHNNPNVAGTYTSDDFVEIASSNDQITITISPATSTSGEATVVIFYCERV